jgi:multiple sugar transport system permease protein
MGYASAIAITLFVIIVIMTLIQFRLGRAWVHYG